MIVTAVMPAVRVMAVKVWSRARGREVRVRVTAARVMAEQARGVALMTVAVKAQR
jgi:hypothetical protein